MGRAGLSGNDTFTLNERVLTDLPDGDAVTMDPSGDSANTKTGKNGNTIFAQNQGGYPEDVSIRVIIGSNDDKYMNALYTQQKASFETFNLMTCTFVKKVGDGKGKVTRVTKVGSGGIFLRPPTQKTNGDGDTEQSVAVWKLRFADVRRVTE